MEELDYSLLPEAAWNKLTAWYGLSQGSRPINRYVRPSILPGSYELLVCVCACRKVVEHGLYMKHCKVEVYLLEFKLCLHPKLNEPVNMTFSRAETIGMPCSLCRANSVVSLLTFSLSSCSHSFPLLFTPTQLTWRQS